MFESARRTIAMCVILGGSALAALLLAADAVAAPTVWSGLTHEFSKLGTDDPLLPEHQDRITDNVWLTRGSSMGLVNAVSECAEIGGCTYTHNSSPLGTEWATAAILANTGKSIAATNWQDLTFADWEAAYGGHVMSNFGQDAVVHLIEDDIYFDFRFSVWDSAFGGAKVTYLRSEPPANAPTGDYNGDLVVNAADYTVWRDTLGQTADPVGSGADGHADGTIDEQDYAFWKQHFGEVVPAGAASLATTVPEPSSWLLLLGGLLIMGATRKHSPRGPGLSY